MAADISGCCVDSKKQKLNNCSSIPLNNSNNNNDNNTNGNGIDGYNKFLENNVCGKAQTDINNEATRGMIVSSEMCFFCFDMLLSHLNQCEPPKTLNFPNECHPLFVSWESGPDRILRGCIGTFNAKNLHLGLSEYAVRSAFNDSRFDPITRDELTKLNVSVSILRHFEDGHNYTDWEIGIHGIKIEFKSAGLTRTATYLPEVAPEQGWDRIQTIDALLRKGGYKGIITENVRLSIRLTRYQSETITVSYQEYEDYCLNKRC